LLEDFLQWLRGLPAPWAYLVLALLSALENVFPPVPADVAVVLGAFLSRHGSMSAVVLGLLCWGANCASALGVFMAARAHGEQFLSSRLGRALVAPQAHAIVRHAYERHGFLGILLSRFLPGVRAAVLPFAGAMGVPATSALGAAALGSALWYLLLVLAGTSLGLSWERLHALVDDATRLLAFCAIASVLGFVFWMRRSRANRRT
jgi:membrane protein DedA with SNARE-associated domain